MPDESSFEDTEKIAPLLLTAKAEILSYVPLNDCLKVVNGLSLFHISMTDPCPIKSTNIVLSLLSIQMLETSEDDNSLGVGSATLSSVFSHLGKNRREQDFFSRNTNRESVLLKAMVLEFIRIVRGPTVFQLESFWPVEALYAVTTRLGLPIYDSCVTTDLSSGVNPSHVGCIISFFPSSEAITTSLESSWGMYASREAAVHAMASARFISRMNNWDSKMMARIAPGWFVLLPQVNRVAYIVIAEVSLDKSVSLNAAQKASFANAL
jgi:hypothetical protein